MANGVLHVKYIDDKQARKIVYIPMSNVAMVEWFESMEDFEKAYPRVR